MKNNIDIERNLLLERKKASPEIAERTRLFYKALGVEDEDDEIGRESEKKDMPFQLPLVSAAKAFETQYGITLDYLEQDTIEVALFKSGLKEDQKKFTLLSKNIALDPQVKCYVLALCSEFAFATRDLQCVKFLVNNNVDVMRSISLNKEGYEVEYSSLMPLLNGFYKKLPVEQKWIDFLFENGLNLDLRNDGTTAFYDIITSDDSGDFAIKMLDRVSNINQIQYERNIIHQGIDDTTIERVEARSYLIAALIKSKYELAKALIEKGADIKPETEKDISILHYAVRDKNTEFAQWFFDTNPSYSLSCDKNSGNLLTTAFASKNYSLFKLLVSKGADVNAEYRDFYYHGECSIFMQLIKEAPEEFTIEILHLANININEKLKNKYNLFYPHKNEDSYLNQSLLMKKYNLAKELIDKGADVNFAVNGLTPLHIVIDDNNLDMAAYLLANNADPTYNAINSTCTNQENCLQKAVTRQNIELVDLILKYNSDPELLNYALIQAIYSQDTYSVELLILKGADVNNLKYSPLRAVSDHNFSNPSNLKIGEMLIKAGADVNSKDDQGRTVLMNAALAYPENPELFAMLINAGADVNYKDENQPDIWWWCQHKNEIVQVIVASGKLNLEGRSEWDMRIYNYAKAQVDFKAKAEKDLAAIGNSCLNMKFISDSMGGADPILTTQTFGWDSVDKMLNYYLKGYKTKFSDTVTQDQLPFFTEIAEKVVKKLGDYVSHYWPQLKATKYSLEEKSKYEASPIYKLTIAPDTINMVGEFIFKFECQEILGSTEDVSIA